MSDLTWIDVEAYWDAESYKGNVISGTYTSGPLKGESYDAVVTFTGGFWISKYTNYRYRQGIAQRYVQRNEKSILKVAKKLLNKIDPSFEIGKLRRVGIQNTGIQSSRSPSGVKYYPAGREPTVQLLFEGSYTSVKWEKEASVGMRPTAEVL